MSVPVSTFSQLPLLTRILLGLFLLSTVAALVGNIRVLVIHDLPLAATVQSSVLIVFSLVVLTVFFMRLPVFSLVARACIITAAGSGMLVKLTNMDWYAASMGGETNVLVVVIVDIALTLIWCVYFSRSRQLPRYGKQPNPQ